MLKYSIVAGLIALYMSPLSAAFATSATFDSLEKNCLFIENKYIDTCPQQRRQVRTINKALYSIWKGEEELSLGRAEMSEKVTQMKKTLQEVDKQLFLTRQRTPQKIFFIQYMIHMMNLYLEELDQTGKLQGKIDQLFAKTYFDAHQEGIAITQINQQQRATPIRQYDTLVPLSLTIRNFSQKPISQIDDIYCFTTIGDEDIVFPLNIPINVLDANRIETINTQLITQDTLLMETTGAKNIHCSMVFVVDEQEYYTPYETFTFTVEEA